MSSEVAELKFDFEKLKVYQMALSYYKLGRKVRFSSGNEDGVLAKQFLRAALSVSLNIAEGAGKTSSLDKRRYYTISRGSMFECVAIMNVLIEAKILDRDLHREMYDLADQVSRMLTTMIKNFEIKAATEKRRR